MSEKPDQCGVQWEPWMDGTVCVTFVHPCLDCGATVRVVNTIEQAHECRPAEDQRGLVAAAWWNGYSAARRS